jgi:transcriptional regulator with XRE-family HTH domain
VPRQEEELPFPVTARQRLGYVIRSMRRNAGLSQPALAAAAGMSRVTIVHYEHGTRGPSHHNVENLERALDAGGLLLSMFEDVEAERRQRARLGPLGSGVTLQGDRSRFVADVTIDDGTLMGPLEHFTKTWRIRNAGTVPWIGRYLRRLGPVSGVNLIASPLMTPIAATSPGEQVDVTVKCVAQALPGSSRGHFKMAREDGSLYFPDRYGEGLVVEVFVRLPSHLEQ